MVKGLDIRLPFPIILWIEPSGSCNLDCPECPTSTGRGGGCMNREDFIRVIDYQPWLKQLNLWHRGEPLLASELPDMIEEASRRGIRTHVHSNGILLGKRDVASRLVEAGLSRISIGVDGPDEDTYREYRRGGSLAEVIAGIEALIEARCRQRVKKPRITVECLVSRQTAEQFRSVRDMAVKWGCDDVKFKTFRVPDIANSEASIALLPDNPRLRRYKQLNSQLTMRRFHSRCWRLAYSAVIAWNGDVLPCCFDAHARFTAGNAFREPLKNIWRGELLSEFQHRVNHGGRDAISMCRNCTEGLPRLYLPERTVLS